ncbi:hypothetical protein LTR62_004844 [Meristemomyces frigidus]|uniref:Uncharacterized protein n=1 Tax=Meristemomyces frigidus TaxID=1508187 RepID=A0AAN7TE39_9PEZI|nr:hypothetical protein LTR62_004844 [Meristemomyces frigidus]
MVAQGGPGGPGGGPAASARESAYNAFTSNLAAESSAASVASALSVAGAASSMEAATTAAASTTDPGTTISTNIPLGLSTTAALASTNSASAAQSVTATSAHSTTSALFPTTASSATSDALTTSSQTTFATSTSAGTGSSSLASSLSSVQPIPSSTISGKHTVASETRAPLPLTGHAHHDALSHGALAAAILVPLLFGLLALLLAFLCLRRRRTQDQTRRHSAAAFLPAMREKFGKFGSVRGTSYTAPVTAAPVMTSERNNAYFTGLDTSSQGSRRGESGEYYAPPRRSEGGTTFDEPPPPYKAKSVPSTGASLTRTSIPDVAEPAASTVIPTVHEPRASTTRSPFADPSPTTTSNLNTAFLASPLDQRPQTSRSTSQRSFNSDQYSETASVHSARAARMSVIEPQIIGGSGNPFGDRTNSVERSPRVSADEQGGMMGRRRNSDVSAL